MEQAEGKTQDGSNDKQPNEKYGLVDAGRSDGELMPPPSMLPSRPTQPAAGLKSSAESNTPKIDLLYNPPVWSAKPPYEYKLDVLKNGTIIETIQIHDKGYYLIGRLPPEVADISMEHQSISRQHAIIQHRENGEVYLYDLGSTHGTLINKKKVKPKAYTKLNVGDVIRFGESTRLYVLEGPDTLRPAEASRTAPKPSAVSKDFIAEFTKKSEDALHDRHDEIFGGVWERDGDVLEDMPQEEEGDGNNFDESYVKKPQVDKSLFDEGDSDDDEFYDRSVLSKKQKNQKKEASKPKVASYESLNAQVTQLTTERVKLAMQLQKLNQDMEDKNQLDDLDAYMNTLSSDLKKESANKLQNQIDEIDKELKDLNRLLEVARPALQGLKKNVPASKSASTSAAPVPSASPTDQVTTSDVPSTDKAFVPATKLHAYPTEREIPLPNKDVIKPAKSEPAHLEGETLIQSAMRKSRKRKTKAKAPTEHKYDDEGRFADFTNLPTGNMYQL
eukprot:TRINITY_DN10809_c0_g1_i2.p1 TRINITY_DN10809_c0_g1~~TRINITY_DN10809_c0_g1_i2.p1  ORF type:complete len:502 (-),score=124.38 TRINITY_DN10809_c0_g1_i2:24-1529(-)